MEQFLNYLGIAGAVIFVFLALGFCIFSHELGHFLAAKWMGLHVDAFSLGFRPFWRKKYKGVEYRLGYLPFGGYVEIPQLDSSNGEPKTAAGEPLPRAGSKERIITAAAGPLFNIISGLLIACIVWVCGIPQDTPKMREITVRSIVEESPEYRAGLRKGDVIVKLNGQTFHTTWAKFIEQILYIIGPVELEVRRDNKPLVIRYIPAENPDAPGAVKKEKIAYPFFTPLIPIQLFPEKNSIAYKAGLRDGDILLKAGGEDITDFMQLQSAFNFSCGKPLALLVRRGEREMEFTVTPQPVPELEEYTHYLAGVIQTIDKDGKISVAELMSGGSAARAGLLPGDILLEANGKKISELTDLPKIMNKGEFEVKLTVERKGKLMNFTVVPQKNTPATIGISMTVYDHPTPFDQLAATVTMSWKSLRGIATGIGNKLGLTEKTSSLKPGHMSGPLGIGTVLFNSVRTSPISGVYVMVIISFALAIFNLLPLPVLDGGHIFFGLIALIFRREVPAKVIEILSYIFVVLLISLMVFVTYSDGKRLVNKFQTGEQQR